MEFVIGGYINMSNQRANAIDPYEFKLLNGRRLSTISSPIHAKVYLAFPGMGKSPLARKYPRYVDADFGNYRTIMGVAKEDENILLKPFAQFIHSFEHPYIVLTNEPKLAEYVHIAKMYLPINPSYSAKKMKVDNATIIKWISDWEEIAKKYSIPIVKINVGLDNYLR